MKQDQTTEVLALISDCAKLKPGSAKTFQEYSDAVFVPGIYGSLRLNLLMYFNIWLHPPMKFLIVIWLY